MDGGFNPGRLYTATGSFAGCRQAPLTLWASRAVVSMGALRARVSYVHQWARK
ncbi:hypothetical protein PENSPDRAFT_654743 [Peniophora sp. CONT]|nr:hypothetical protein PENSPDRAFT_654743 [Peniophora sp. CONT]